jgi:predicted Zn-ribbon and HTH transcriptional regulator
MDCGSCGHEFEPLISHQAAAECPSCGVPNVMPDIQMWIPEELGEEDDELI